VIASAIKRQTNHLGSIVSISAQFLHLLVTQLFEDLLQLYGWGEHVFTPFLLRSYLVFASGVFSRSRFSKYLNSILNNL